jgi:beta-phosphoglucomutase
MINSVIFDLDGLLADTEKLHRQAYRTVLSELGGVALPDDVYDDHWIRRGRDISEYLTQHHIHLDAAQVRSAKDKLYRKLVAESAQEMPGATQVLESLFGKKKLALATASYRSAAMAVLGALQIERFFDCIASKEDTDRTKPFPDVLLYVSGRLCVAPENCLVIEDSEKGVTAACSAGMKSVAVPNPHTRGHDFSAAMVVLDSLAQLTPALIDQLGGAKSKKSSAHSG